MNADKRAHWKMMLTDDSCGGIWWTMVDLQLNINELRACDWTQALIRDFLGPPSPSLPLRAVALDALSIPMLPESFK